MRGSGLASRRPMRNNVTASRHLLLRAHVLDGLRTLPSESIHCVVTSPPYFGLRDYKTPAATWGDGWRGHLGLEPTPDLFIAHLVEVFREVRRVLRSDGTAFVVLGDSYANDAKWGGASGGKHVAELHGETGIGRGRRETGLKPGDLIGIPWRFAFAAQADGWLLRSGIVWAKSSCMPESVTGSRWERHRIQVGASRRAADHEAKAAAWADVGKPGGARGTKNGNGSSTFDSGAEWQDCPGCAKCRPHDGLALRRGMWRPTSAHEYIFMLAKSEDYFADGEDLREPHEMRPQRRTAGRPVDETPRPGQPRQSWPTAQREEAGVDGHPAGRNLRSVWHLGPEPFPEAHFAVFPSEIPRRCILAGTSSGGCCETCGAPLARVVEREAKPGRTRGWRPTCSCAPGEPPPPLVLDPFAGSGTTGRVALALGRRFIGIDLSAPYLFGIARPRVVAADVGASLAEPLRLRTIEGPLFS